jgi:hypothetical protein
MMVTYPKLQCLFLNSEHKKIVNDSEGAEVLCMIPRELLETSKQHVDGATSSIRILPTVAPIESLRTLNVNAKSQDVLTIANRNRKIECTGINDIYFVSIHTKHDTICS